LCPIRASVQTFPTSTRTPDKRSWNVRTNEAEIVRKWFGCATTRTIERSQNVRATSPLGNFRSVGSRNERLRALQMRIRSPNVLPAFVCWWSYSTIQGKIKKNILRSGTFRLMKVYADWSLWITYFNASSRKLYIISNMCNQSQLWNLILILLSIPFF
jgi:hypothetical protein